MSFLMIQFVKVTLEPNPELCENKYPSVNN